MNPVNLYMLPGRIGLKFTDSKDRDSFWNALSDAARAAAERIANRTIRLYPDRMKDPNGLIIPISGNGTGPVTVTQPKPAPPAPKPTPQSGNVNVAAGGDPFALTGNVVKALPGMVAVQSNIPPGSVHNAPVSDLEATSDRPTPENVPVRQPESQASVPEASKPSPEDPEPPDKRTKAYRAWWARHHGQANSPK